MRKILLGALLGLLCFSILTLGCTLQETPESVAGEPMAATAKTRVSVDPEPELIDVPAGRWSMDTHTSVAEVCAAQWGMSAARQNIISEAADMPDVYQSGIDNAYNQQWSHAFLYTYFGINLWGDADDDFHDNLDGDSGEIESPEGYNGKWAGYYYNRGDQVNGDWYLGYALHYMEDVGLILHSSVPSINMLLHHFDFENWVKNNLTSGHNFLAAVQSDYYYYAVTDPKEGIRDCAYGSSYANSDLGETVWDAYVDDGFPTATGSGSSTLVSHTRQMLVRAARYTKGAIKYALDKYNQWGSTY